MKKRAFPLRLIILCQVVVGLVNKNKTTADVLIAMGYLNGTA